MSIPRKLSKALKSTRPKTQDYPVLDTVLQTVRNYCPVQAAWAVYQMFRLQTTFCEVQDVENHYGSRVR